MGEVLKATRAQIMAARAIVKRRELGIGPEPNDAVRAIANPGRKPSAVCKDAASG